MTQGEMAIVGLGLSGILTTAAFIAGRAIGARKTQQAVQREHGEVRALLDITEAVNGSLDLRQVMSLIVRRVGERVGAQRCSIVFVDQAA